MISTRGRYAIRVLIDLAEHRGEAFTPMKEVAKRQEISLKYLEPDAYYDLVHPVSYTHLRAHET